MVATFVKLRGDIEPAPLSGGRRAAGDKQAADTGGRPPGGRAGGRAGYRTGGRAGGRAIGPAGAHMGVGSGAKQRRSIKART